MIHQSSYKEIADIFSKEKSFVLTTHINPDGDGLGCEYALYYHLVSMKKNVRIINAGKLPDNFLFMNEQSIFEQYHPGLHDSCVSSSAVILCLDLNDARRLDAMERIMTESAGIKIVIDHHLRPKVFADHYLMDPESCAVGEILYNLLYESIGARFTYEISMGLYIAIMTDTGSFRFPKTTSRVHAITAELMKSGIRPERMYQNIFDEFPIGRTKLLGRILAGVETFCNGRASILRVTQEMLKETGTTEEDVENIVNFGLTVRGVLATALIFELPKETKMSFRSRGDIDVSLVARRFGGGGHQNAAGARVAQESFAEVELIIMQEFESLLS